MAVHTAPRSAPVTDRTREGPAAWHDPAYQGFALLWLGFTVAPILFGIDKFFDNMTDWGLYLDSFFVDSSPFGLDTTMRVVGVVEIVAGLVVLARPRIGGYLVAAWLAGIIVNLLMLGDYHDVALRDFGLLLGALALARLATSFRPALVRSRSS